MPITPFHFGPAALLKAATNKHFIFVTFGLMQVVIDLETITWIVLGEWPIHRFLHSYLGATVAALAVVLLGKPLGEWLLTRWNALLGEPQRSWLGVNPSISYPCAASGALFGGYSHVFLDSIMHSDMQPLAPFPADNALLYIITIDQLHTLCLALGTPAAIALLIILIRRKRATR